MSLCSSSADGIVLPLVSRIAPSSPIKVNNVISPALYSRDIVISWHGRHDVNPIQLCIILFLLYSAVLASVLLNEKLNLHGKLGCVLAIVGSTVIVIHAPEESEMNDLYEVGRNMISIGEHVQ